MIASMVATKQSKQNASQDHAQKPGITPPLSVSLAKQDDDQCSELSDMEGEEDNGEIEPDHYYENGRIPVFKPTMDQFRSFKKFIGKIDKYGMKSGIVKVIPPKEWRDSLPPLDDAVKSIKVKNPITQEIAGAQGTYRQANIEKQRSYNLPQWRQLCEGSEHQPPARRGERRRNQARATRPITRASATSSPATKRRRGRPRKSTLTDSPDEVSTEVGEPSRELKVVHPPTPKSPRDQTGNGDEVEESPKKMESNGELGEEDLEGSEVGTPTKSRGRQPKSVSSRRKYNRRAAADFIDEAAFKDFNYRITNQAEYTPERCSELEKNYWQSITYNSPLYGADMPGSLFDERTTVWNVAKLENLLDILGQNVPGVNTAYLYLGMWKSTFAWHLEDVDLYSINYIHFGAPKQWYSISQEDARRFEAAMRSVWPADSKQCSQFLRHKTYLISPSLLQSQYNIRVNRLVHHEGEFVITFPYGYHSGYNLGYNCAESVNFATEAWLQYGRVAKKCNCTEDSVWIDVDDIERKLRGDETEYEETDEDEGADVESQPGTTELPTPPASVEGKSTKRERKRKRDSEDHSTIKKIRVRIKPPARPPCVLCPNDIPTEKLLPTDDGQQAHKLCALYIPETFIQGPADNEKIYNIANINKARLDLKCNFCRSMRGACFQCSHGKCTRAYHATCAAAGGVLVDVREIPVIGEDGKEYTDLGIEFKCKFHRPKRPKNWDGDELEENKLVQDFAHKVQAGDVIQVQFLQGDIFAGVIVEKRLSEKTVLMDVLPKGDRVEVEYKWILVHSPTDSQLHVSSSGLQALANQPKAEVRTTIDPRQREYPITREPFCGSDGPYTWAEFRTATVPRVREQVSVDITKPNVFWYYIGSTSTEARAQYTEDPRNPRHNIEGDFLKKTPSFRSTAAPSQRRSLPASYPASHPKPHAAPTLPATSSGQTGATLVVAPRLSLPLSTPKPASVPVQQQPQPQPLPQIDRTSWDDSSSNIGNPGLTASSQDAHGQQQQQSYAIGSTPYPPTSELQHQHLTQFHTPLTVIPERLELDLFDMGSRLFNPAKQREDDAIPAPPQSSPFHR